MTIFLLGKAIILMEDEENANEGKKEVEMESEEMGGLTSLSVEGIICHEPYEEPDERISDVLFSLGLASYDVNADDDQDDLVSAPNKMEIEVDLEEEGRDVDIISNDSNKRQWIPLSVVKHPKAPNPIWKRLKTSNKFGKGEIRGGNSKSTGTVGMILSAPEAEAADNDGVAGNLPAPEAEAADNDGVAGYLPASEAEAADNDGVAGNRPATINETKLTKAQIIRRLNKSKNKHQRDEDKIDAVTKKLTTAINECKTLAGLAQEQRRESNLAFQHADCLISDICDKMTTRLHQADRDVAADKSVALDAVNQCGRDVAAAKSVALDAVNQCAATSAAVSAAEHSYYHTKACATLKKNAKQLDIQQRSFDVDVKNLRSASKRNTQKNEVVIGKQATMIRHLQTKVASAELSVELMWGQLEKEHKDAMSDLMVASRSKIRDIKYDHVIFLAEEKKKIQLQLITEHQRQNSLYTEVLDYRQDARVARKAGTISNFYHHRD